MQSLRGLFAGLALWLVLGAAADAVHEPVIVPYETIPHFPKSTVEGHSGRIVAGMLGGAPVLVMQGRVHFYEGYSLKDITFPMRVMGALGTGAGQGEADTSTAWLGRLSRGARDEQAATGSAESPDTHGHGHGGHHAHAH